jgi:hypothetical protein
MLIGVAPYEIDPLIEEFGPERLDIVTWCGSEEEARALVERYC